MENSSWTIPKWLLTWSEELTNWHIHISILNQSDGFATELNVDQFYKSRPKRWIWRTHVQVTDWQQLSKIIIGIFDTVCFFLLRILICSYFILFHLHFHIFFCKYSARHFDGLKCCGNVKIFKGNSFEESDCTRFEIYRLGMFPESNPKKKTMRRCVWVGWGSMRKKP